MIRLRHCIFYDHGFNRYMVECESEYAFFASLFFSVLIDTWWNVNLADWKCFVCMFTVLIDTWWNVNITGTTITSTITNSFNRYMVECE